MKDRFGLACQLWDEGKVRTAFHLFLREAKAGDLSAQLNLAHFYSEGIAVRRNRRKSLHWLRRAASRGYAPAVSNIAIIFRNEKRYWKALKWFEMAGEIDDGDALVEAAKIRLDRLNQPEAAKVLLRKAIASDWITEASMETAQELMLRLEQSKEK